MTNDWGQDDSSLDNCASERTDIASSAMLIKITFGNKTPLLHLKFKFKVTFKV